MRLLDVQTYKLHTFYGDNIPPYAILSHTWLQNHDEEVTFAHLQSQPLTTWNQLPGARKIILTCRQAARDRHSWAWIDTCCINKSDSSELSEAINSMFKWYQQAAVCYVFLNDIDLEGEERFVRNRWWTRAWTLQELLAPSLVQFFDSNWQYLGTKTDRAVEISHATNIDIATLRNSSFMYMKSVAQRMSWAAHRQAERDEDLAYALLGIFDINMTMQYGEGMKAFVRLQREIVHSTNDMSIFAWGLYPQALEDVCKRDCELNPKLRSDLSIINSTDHPGSGTTNGLYASGPSDFSASRDVVHLAQHIGDAGVEERYGLQVLKTAMIVSSEWGFDDQGNAPWPEWSLALLPCTTAYDSHALVGILLRRWRREPDRTRRYPFARDVYSCLVRGNHVSEAVFRALKIDTLETSRDLMTSQHYSLLNRMLIIKGDDIDIPFEILQPTPWREEPGGLEHFIAPSGTSAFFTVLRFYRPNAPLAVYVGYQTNDVVRLNPQEHATEVVPCTIRAVSSSTPGNEVVTEMTANAGIITSGPRVKCKHICGHDVLSAKVALKTVFNQALTTVTLAKRNMLQRRTTLQIPETALCLEPQEWDGSLPLRISVLRPPERRKLFTIGSRS